MAKLKDVPRQLALDVLFRFEKAGQEKVKADSLLQAALSKHPDLSEQDRGFCRALVMGTLRRWLVYDEWIKSLTGRPLKNLTPQIRCILRLGFFQLEGLSQVPAYAAINSSVELAKSQKNSPKTIQFLNAVLREAQRRLEGEGFAIPAVEADFPGYLLGRLGWPVLWTERLLQHYAPADLLAMAEAGQSPAALSIRVNCLKTSVAAYQQLLTEKQILFEALPDLPEGLLLLEFSGSPRHLPGYEKGLFYVQDAASMWVSRFLNPQAEERILDLCAAPGSKATHLAALMENTGQILAIEPKPERLRLLEENIQRLGVSCVTVQQADGLTFETGSDLLFDKVLVDAPCSGSGTLRRHPEMLPQAKKLDLAALNKLQKALLRRGFALLKPGGVLVYSTCSILPEENRQLIKTFLAETSEAMLESDEQRLIQTKADGFYAARLIKKL